jgi:predicted transglutaminase-like cysteine proteinase
MRVIILILSLTACSALPPEPFDYGNVVAAPVQCQQYQRSGGFCSLQFALDEVHARFKYQADHVTHPQMNSFAGVDVWQKLPADGGGDCEDFALTLRWYLNQRGITGTKLLAVRTDSGQMHMALELSGS